MINRVELLHSLLRFDQPLSKILSLLKPFGWDSDRELVILERQHVAAILERYLTNELLPAQLEDWANALESREDIGSEQSFEDLLDEVIYELANPSLTRPLSKEIAKDWLKQLTKPAAASK